MGVSVIRVDDVSKRFVIRKDKSLKERLVNFGRSRRHKDDFWALRHVSMDIDSGSTVGLIGPNGSGKSTLLKTIGGIIQPSSGTVLRRGRLAALLELGAGFHPDLTGRENVYLNSSILGLSRQQTNRYFDAIVDFSGIERFIDTQVKFYSSGMYVRLAFAVAVHVDPDVLLVDEVLAVGDEPFQRKCMDRIRMFQSEGRTIVLVTHALDQVGDICDRAVVLEHGEVIVDGEPREALRTLRADYEQARIEEQEQQEQKASGGHVSTRARVASVQLLHPDGRPVATIVPGEDVVVRAVVDSSGGELADWIVGVGVDTALGQVLLGTNTKLLGERLPPLRGIRSVDVLLPRLWLGEGQYFVHASVGEWGGGEIHRLPEAAALTVRSEGAAVGPLHVEPRLLDGSTSR
jgi:ABC-2 type transport system ATP-binding protein